MYTHVSEILPIMPTCTLLHIISTHGCLHMHVPAHYWIEQRYLGCDVTFCVTPPLQRIGMDLTCMHMNYLQSASLLFYDSLNAEH